MMLRLKSVDPRIAELGRFAINGVVATAVHYGVLSFNLNVLGFASAGVANFFAAWFGIAASFIGSRFFVFRRKEASWVRQALRFLALYASIACLHGLVLFAWTDTFHMNYTAGFTLATVLQTSLSYLGNKLLVFSTP